MPIPPRTTTLAAAECAGGVRVYVKTSGGLVSELCNNTTQQELADAIQKKNLDVAGHTKGWFLGTDLSFRSGNDSALCAFAWAAWSQSVFYQDDMGTIREKRHLNAWADTSFEQKDCLMGTNVAAVYSPDASKVVLFYQDKEGYICARSARSWAWGAPIRLTEKATKGTGIGATAWGDLKDTRLYFQNDKGEVCEWKGAFGDAKWTRTSFSKKYDYEVGDITAVSWDTGAQIRLYLQDKNAKIVEKVYSDGKWMATDGNFRADALPNSDIIAYVRHTGKNGFCLVVVWAGQDQQLYQSVWSPAHSSWSKAEAIEAAIISDAGDVAGCWTGDLEYFEDKCTDDSAITTVQLAVKDKAVVGVTLHFDDESKTPVWRGSSKGAVTLHDFVLDKGEDITQIWYAADDRGIRGLKFGTSKPRQSDWYGQAGEKSDVWSHGGYAIGGLQGACAPHALFGLSPIWSTRMRGLHPEELQKMLDRATKSKALADSQAAKAAQYSTKVTTFKTEFDAQLKTLAAKAMTGIVDTARAIEYLHFLERFLAQNKLGVDKKCKTDIGSHVKDCSAQADVVEGFFKTVSDFCGTKHEEGQKLHKEVEDALLKMQPIVADLTGFYTEMGATMQDLGATIPKIGCERDLCDKYIAKAQTRKDTGDSDEKDAVKDRLGNVHVNEARRRVQEAKRDIESWTQQKKAVEEQLGKAQGDLKELEKLKKDLDRVKSALETAQASLETLHSGDVNSQAQYKELAASVKNISKVTVTLDDHTCARKFAEHLLKALEGIAKLDALKKVLPIYGVDLALLQSTMQGVAKKA